MMKRFFFVVSTISFLVGCSNNEPDGPSPNEPTEIKMSSDILNTRAPIVTDSEGNLTEATSVPVLFARAANADIANWSTVGINEPTDGFSSGIIKATFHDTGDITFANNQYYSPISTQNAHFLGFAPEGEYTTGNGIPTTIEWTISGKEDVLFTEEDVSGNKDSHGNQKLSATFGHLLTWHSYFLKAEDNEAKAFWGKVKGITIKNQNNTITLELSPNTKPTFSGGPVEFTTTGKNDQLPGDVDLPLAAEDAIFYSQAIIEPVEDSNEYEIIVNTENFPGYAVKVSLEDNMQPNTRSEITLTFKSTGIVEITAKAQITKWEDGPNGSATIE